MNQRPRAASLVTVLATLMVLLVGACGDPPAAAPPAKAPPPRVGDADPEPSKGPRNVDVSLEVEGTTEALVIAWYVPTDERMNEGTEEHVDLPWRKAVKGESGWTVTVTVGMPLTTGLVQPEATCRIRIDGKEVRTTTGPNPSCDYQVP
jgi:hypothetical protein